MTAPRACSRALHVLEDRSPRRRIGDHASTPVGRDLARLELRLHEQDEITVVTTRAEQRVEHGLQRDEGEVGDDDVEGAERPGSERADVQPFVYFDPRVCAQSRVELPVPDVDRDDAAPLRIAGGSR